jgi:hypothetical protein
LSLFCLTVEFGKAYLLRLECCYGLSNPFEGMKRILKVFAVLGLSIFGLLVTLLIINIIGAHVRAYRIRDRQNCINNMRIIQAAKDDWAKQHGATNGVLVTEANIKPFLISGTFRECKVDGKYSLQPIGTAPTCSVHGSLDDPKWPPLPRIFSRGERQN